MTATSQLGACSSDGVKVGKFEGGLAKYRCLRSTSALEGNHAKVNRLRPTNAKHASLHVHSLWINYLDFRTIIAVQKRAGDLPKSLGHCELTLLPILTLLPSSVLLTG